MCMKFLHIPIILAIKKIPTKISKGERQNPIGLDKRKTPENFPEFSDTYRTKKDRIIIIYF